MASKTKTQYKFVSEPEDDLTCLICLEVAEDPWQHGKCGRLFCRECLDQLDSRQPCPNCRENQPQYFEDNRSKRVIRALKVKCSNFGRGCEWVGTVATLKDHVDTCTFSFFPCPNQCGKYFSQKDLVDHLRVCSNRDYACLHCGKQGTFLHISTIHDKVCEKKEVPCLLCGQTMQRSEIYKHAKTECPEVIACCKYNGIGCTTQMRRKLLKEHEENDSLHLHMAIETVSLLKKNAIATLKEGESLTFKVTDYENRRKKSIGFTSQPLYTSPGGYLVDFRINVDGDGRGKGVCVSIFISILEGDHNDSLEWPLTGEVTFVLLNQLEDKNHYIRTTEIKPDFNMQPGKNRGMARFISHSRLEYNASKKTQYLKNDTLYFRVSVKTLNHKQWLECGVK